MTIRVTTTRVPTAQDAGYACARVGFIRANDANDLYAKATAAGFTHLGNNQYSHSDGSWLMLDASGRVQRGAGGAQFQGIPGGRTQQAQATRAAQPAAATYANGGTQIDSSRPGIPSSMRGYGIAQIGLVNAQTVHSACQRAGFVDVGGAYVHADGSWVRYQGAISVGWKGYSLRELPYNRSGGWR